MELVERNTYFSVIRTWSDVPFCQYESWIDAQATNPRKVLYFMDEHIASIGFLKTFAGVKWLQMECPATNGKVSVAERKAFYETIQARGYSIVEINDRQPYDAEVEIALRQAGFLRPVGSFSFQLSNYIDLTQPIAFNENWRRNLKKADTAGLVLELVSNVTEPDLTDFLALYQQMSAHKHLALPFNKEYIRFLLSDPRFRLYFVKQADTRIAAMLVHTSGSHSGLLYAANGEQANDLHAGYWMYREILKDLAQKGFKTFDMEKLAAATHSTNSVFQFKQGIKGQLTPLNGEWQTCKRAWMAQALYLLKKYWWKRMQA